MTDEVARVKKWWELRAASFQAEADIDVGLNWTGLGVDDDLDLLGDVTDADVVELGCGGGQCAVELARRGASVTGVDLSAAQLAFATELAAEHDRAIAQSPGTIEFVQGDITDLPMGDDRFDLAYNAYVFQWITDLEACFREAERVLDQEGRFVFSMPHPVYELADPETGRVVESYFETGQRDIEQPEMDLPMPLSRHRVADVYNALVDAGFRVDRLHEPGSADPDEYEPGPWGERTPELMSKLPTTLVVEARSRS